jgi:glutathione S-transferase
VPGVYRIFGVEPSPYSVKVRSYFRYKGIPHEWIPRSAASEAEFRRFAKLPLIPAVATPEGLGLQDSTPILERMEALFPEPGIHPEDPVLFFLSALIEEFGDEWGNKWMFHYRWARDVDRRSASERIAGSMLPALAGEGLAAAAAKISERMVDRVWFVGSNAETAPQIEDSYREAVALLEAHLAARPYLFGGRPAFGDFGLWGQLYECWTDPTPGAILRESAPSVVAWVERMLEPAAEGPFEARDALLPTLLPFVERQIGRLFLPWSDANARAIASGSEELHVELGGRRWTQKPQKYHAKSLAELRRRHAAAAGRRDLDPVLERTGCLTWLTPQA